MAVELYLDWSEARLHDEFRAREGKWRLVSLACWGSIDVPRFASLWWTEDAPPNQELITLERQQDLQLAGIRRAKQGMFPTIVTSVGAVAPPHGGHFASIFSGVFERTAEKPNGWPLMFFANTIGQMKGTIGLNRSPIRQLDFSHLDDDHRALFCGVELQTSRIQNFGTSSPHDSQPAALISPNVKSLYVPLGAPMHTRGFETESAWRENGLFGKRVLDSILWSGNFDWKAASGGWLMSAATFIRVLCGLESKSKAPQLLAPETSRALWERVDPAAPETGLLWKVVPNAAKGVTRIEKGGSLPGFSTHCLFEAEGPPLFRAESRPSWAAAVFVNSKGALNANTIRNLVSSAEMPEAVDLLPSLFEDIEP